MKIQTNVIITIGTVLMIVLSVIAFNMFSFAASSNNTTSPSTTTTTTNANTSKLPSQMMTTTTNPAAQNTTTSLIGGPYTACTGTDDYLWRHVYNVKNGEPWGQNPGRLNITSNSQYKYGSCVTVTGQVYSAVSTGGTHDEPDGDLHFTLALDQKFWGLSNPNDPTCTPSPSHGLPAGCKNIIVEVICHKTPPASTYTAKGHYCDNVDSHYPPGHFPQQGDKPVSYTHLTLPTICSV